jgi:AmmeMemoRadiSam system protein A
MGTKRGEMVKQLDSSDRSRLLAIARRAIEAVVRREAAGAHLDPEMGAFSAALTEPAAAFVTIHEHGELRGCIGLMRFETPLWLNVREAAVAAALDDPRFLPVDESELPALELEVSVLEPPVELPNPAGFAAGRHGIIVERGMRRGLLLPQVATEMGWDESRMLAAVCRKANLPPDSWRDPSTRLFIFESTCFGEADFEGSASEPAAI